MSSTVPGVKDRKQIEESILALESQRAILGDDVVDVALVSLHQDLAKTDQSSLPQRKQVTVLCADLVGFTALSGAMDAEDVADLVNQLWARLDPVVWKQSGTIDKHLGDGVVALFGAPVAKEDDPERAVVAGLAMQAELGEWVKEYAKIVANPALAGLSMRIGIHTGPVLFGAVGSKGKFTASGDTVHIASDLESAAPAGGVLVSDTTWRQVAGRFEAKPRSIWLKGYEKLLPVYVVGDEKSWDRRSSGRGVAGIETRIVGREAELGQLCAAYEQVVEEGRARIVTVLGEAGIGKSRLLQEFSVWLGNQSGVRGVGKVLSAKASAESEYHPYSLVREWITSEFQITSSTPDSLAREQLVSGMASVSGGDSAMAEFIGHLIGLDFSSSPHIQTILSDAKQIRGRAFYYLARFFRVLCQEQPIIMRLEDIHWADSGSLDAIEYLAQECADLPLLIVCMARPSLLERRSEWGTVLSGSTTLSLAPLQSEASAVLVREILRHVQQIPEQLVRTITEAAEGNAFYIEELVKVLIDDGVIVQGEAEWHIREGGLGELRIPPTLTAVLQARMDRLPQAERTLLQRASVVGKTFWDSALDNLEDGVVDIQDRARLLTNLVRHEFIEPGRTSTFEGAVEYHFRHAILHEVVYESVLLRHRRLYHERVAEWLIQAVQGQMPTSMGLIGEHFAQAGRDRDAAYWFGKAADQARETYLPAMAIDYYRKAIALYQETGGVESEMLCQPLYYQLGTMYYWWAEYEEAVDALVKADHLAEQAGRDRERSQVWTLLSRVQKMQRVLAEAVESAEKAIALARKADSLKELTQAFAVKVFALITLLDLEAAEALCHEVLPLCRGEGLETELLDITSHLGSVHLMKGQYARTIDFYQEALTIGRFLGDRRRICFLLNNIAISLLCQGKYEQAESFLDESLQVAIEIDDRGMQPAILKDLGVLRTKLGRYDEAVEALHQADGLTRGRYFINNSTWHVTLAEARLGLEQIDQAQQAADNALRIAQSQDYQRGLGCSWRIQGQIAACREYRKSTIETSATTNSPWIPEECFAQSAEIFTETGQLDESALALREWAIYQYKTEGLTAAMPHWREARGIFEQLEIDFEVGRMDDLLAGWSQESGVVMPVVDGRSARY